MARGKNQVTLTFAGDAGQLDRVIDATGRNLRDIDKDARKGFEGVERAGEGLAPKLRSSGRDAGNKFSSGIESGLGDLDDVIGGGFDIGSITGALSGKIKGLSGKLSPVAGAAGAAIAGAFVVGFLDDLDFGKAEDKLSAQLGATAKESERLGGIAGDLYADAYGDSIEQVNEALGAVTFLFGDINKVSDKELAEASQHALDFAATFGTDVSEAVGAVGILLENDLVDSAETGFDLIFRGMQELPPAFRGDLIPAVEEYAGFLSSMGITGDEAFALITESAKQFGSFGIDKSLDALKEFQLRVVDETAPDTIAAFETIGLNGEAMADMIAAGGEDAREALNKTVEGLLAIEDPSLQAQTAIMLFGTPIEDLSAEQIPQFLEDLQGMTKGLGDVEGAADRSGASLNDNLATKLEGATRRGKELLRDFAGFVVSIAEGDFTTAWDTVRRFFVNNWRIMTAVATIGLSELVLRAVGNFGKIKGAGRAMKDFFVNQVWSPIRGAAVSTWQAINRQWQGAVGGIKRAGGAVKDFFVNTVWGTIRRTAGATVGAVAGFFRSLPGRLGRIASNAVSSFLAPFRSLPGKVGGFVGDALSKIPGSGIAKSIFGKIFQSGGIVPGTGPQPIIAHGGEVVLNRGQQANLFRLLESGGASSSGGRGGGMTVVINVAGSIRSDRDLVKVVADELRSRGFLGVR